VGLRALYGDEHPYAWPTDGTVKTVSGFSRSDVQSEQRAVFPAGDGTILIAGDITPEEAKPVLEKAFGDWKGSGSAAAATQDLAIRPHEGLRVLIVDRPDAVQTVIRFVMPGVKYKDERRTTLRLMNTILGGSFTSRLNQNLREDHGYTYGARSRFSMEPSAGHFIASANVKADVTGRRSRSSSRSLGGSRRGISPSPRE
jgi:predicted Zn-dependent peptidase